MRSESAIWSYLGSPPRPSSRRLSICGFSNPRTLRERIRKGHCNNNVLALNKCCSQAHRSSTEINVAGRRFCARTERRQRGICVPTADDVSLLELDEAKMEHPPASSTQLAVGGMEQKRQTGNSPAIWQEWCSVPQRDCSTWSHLPHTRCSPRQKCPHSTRRHVNLKTRLYLVHTKPGRTETAAVAVCRCPLLIPASCTLGG